MPFLAQVVLSDWVWLMFIHWLLFEEFTEEGVGFGENELVEGSMKQEGNERDLSAVQSVNFV